jgi:hypothetical protein
MGRIDEDEDGEAGLAKDKKSVHELDEQEDVKEAFRE